MINSEGQEVIFEKCDNIFPHWSEKTCYGKILNNKMEFINLEPPNMLRNLICQRPIAYSSNIDSKSNQVFVLLKKK